MRARADAGGCVCVDILVCVCESTQSWISLVCISSVEAGTMGGLRGPGNCQSVCGRLGACPQSIKSREYVTVAQARESPRGEMPPLGRPVAAAPSMTTGTGKPPAQKPPPGMVEEIGALRRENQELRQQLLQLVAAAAPPTPGAEQKAMPAQFWLEAQLTHCRRQVSLLSDALVLKAELTADLETILTQQLRMQPPPSTQQAQFCRVALKKLRGVDFAEEVARQIKADEQAQPRAGRGRGGAAAPSTAATRAKTRGPIGGPPASRAARPPPSVQ